jgi:hypothetical protein
MTDLVRGEDFARLFHTFGRVAWRWEAQGTYREPYEVEPWQRWRDGVPDDYEWMQSWLEDIRVATRAGRRFERVRMLTDPLTEYLEWQIEVTPLNIGAGEDIRVLPERRARELGLPGDDFWLFDDERVARMHFGSAGFDGAEIITAPDVVARHVAWRELAWTHAVRFDEYQAGKLAERST